jgi:hypothetical protein
MSDAAPRSSQAALTLALERFRDSVNADTRLPGLLRGWDRLIRVEDTDTGWQRQLVVSDGRIAGIDLASDNGAKLVHLRAQADVLTAVFEGLLNPTDAFLGGELQVFAEDRDQVTLDAICLVLWGA